MERFSPVALQVEFRKFQKDEQLDLELEEPAEDRPESD